MYLKRNTEETTRIGYNATKQERITHDGFSLLETTTNFVSQQCNAMTISVIHPYCHRGECRKEGTNDKEDYAHI